MLLILVMRTNTKRMLPILGLTKSNAAGGDGNYYKSRERERGASFLDKTSIVGNTRQVRVE